MSGTENFWVFLWRTLLNLSSSRMHRWIAASSNFSSWRTIKQHSRCRSLDWTWVRTWASLYETTNPTANWLKIYYMWETRSMPKLLTRSDNCLAPSKCRRTIYGAGGNMYWGTQRIQTGSAWLTKQGKGCRTKRFWTLTEGKRSIFESLLLKLCWWWRQNQKVGIQNTNPGPPKAPEKRSSRHYRSQLRTRHGLGSLS